MQKNVAGYCTILVLAVTAFGCGPSRSPNGGMGGVAGDDGSAGSSAGGSPTSGSSGNGSGGTDAAGGAGSAGDGPAGGTSTGGATAGSDAGGRSGAGNGGEGGRPPEPEEPWPAPTPDASFTANFIWQAADGPQNSWLAFRKRITLSSKPARAIAAIAADSKYWLWINGRLAVFEGGLKRGPNRTDSYYDEVDLEPFFAAGDNTIAALVWFWGKDGFSHTNSGKGGLLFQADIDGTRVVSDASWRVRSHTGYLSETAPGANFRLPEWNVQFDARRDLAGWMLPEYDDTVWAAATVKGRPPVAPWRDYGSDRSHNGAISA